MKLKKILLIGIAVVSANSFTGFKDIKPTDMYPLHQQLNMNFYTDKDMKHEGELLSRIIRELDIENNPRYMKTGVVYRDGRAYEFPLKEVEDFDIKVAHYNTYCNVFVMDTLNIMATTTNDESYRITNTPINANTLRNRFDNSPYWIEVNKNKAIENARAGKVVVLSYVAQPHGHVAFVRGDSKDGNIYLWNVGAVNKNKLLWDRVNNVKYFVRESR